MKKVSSRSGVREPARARNAARGVTEAAEQVQVTTAKTKPAGAGQIIQRGDRRYLVRWYVGRDGNGKRRYASETVKGTRKAAEKKLREVLGKKDQGVEYDPARIALDKHLDDWLASLVGKRSANTITLYKDLLRLYVRPLVGAVRIDKLRLGHVEDDLVAALRGKTIGGRTIQLAVRTLGQACKWGVRRGRMARNPCEGIGLGAGEKREMAALDPDQVRALRNALSDSPHAVLIDFLLFTGARPAEALALRWTDLEFDEGLARIQQSLSRFRAEKDGQRKGDYAFTEPKANSGRSIPLPSSLVASLRRHRSAQRARVLEQKLGAYYRKDLDLVFGNEIGEPLDKHNLIARHFKTALETAKLPKTIRLYDLRHTHASNLLAAGEPVKAVAERLGHTSAKMTLDVYAHVMPGQRERLAGVAEALFGG